MSKKTVFFVTSSRSDFALIEPMLKFVRKDKDLKPFLFVTGDHVSPKAGNTYKQIEAKGIRIDAKYRIKSTNPSSQVGEVVSFVSKLLRKQNISYAFVAGDRKEILASALACALTRIPIFHSHGGDVSFGMIDDSMRHAMTKLASIHFPVSPLSARRIKQMGEEPWRIYMTGSPDADHAKAKLPEYETLQKFGLMKKEYALLLLNPETLLSVEENGRMAKEILEALSLYRGKIAVVSPNNDPSAEGIRKVFNAHAKAVVMLGSLPQAEYLSLLKNAAFLIGNSSSGITEAASFKVPVINVGHRQDGRERNQNIIDMPAESSAIGRAIKKAQSGSFLHSISKMKNVYGSGGASERMYKAFKKVIATYDTRALLYKKFPLI